jgi:hypothetical protein
MARKIIWAYAAEEDLETAASFVDRALEAGCSLDESAERGRMVPEAEISVSQRPGGSAYPSITQAPEGLRSFTRSVFPL